MKIKKALAILSAPLLLASSFLLFSQPAYAESGRDCFQFYNRSTNGVRGNPDNLSDYVLVRTSPDGTERSGQYVPEVVCGDDISNESRYAVALWPINAKSSAPAPTFVWEYGYTTDETAYAFFRYTGSFTDPTPEGLSYYNPETNRFAITEGFNADETFSVDDPKNIEKILIANRVDNEDEIDDFLDDEFTRGSEEEPQTCASNAGALGWILCPFVEFMEGAINELAGNALGSLLFVDVGGDQVESAWGSVRNLANALFAVVFLIVIFMQALSFGDAYTIKKLLPRLAIGVILTQISLPIMGVLVDISNVLGAGIADLVLSAVDATDATVQFNLFGENADGFATGIGGFLGLGVGVLATASAASSILALAITSLSTIMITVLVVVMVLTAREFAIILMVVFAPIAFVSWVLPNTERLFKEWMDNFIKLLLMFPLIMALVSLGPMVSRIMGVAGSSDNAFDILLQVAAYVVPYAAIPFTFRFAGKVFGSLAAVAQNAGSRMSSGGGAGGKGTQSKYQQKKAQIESGGLFKSNKGIRGAFSRGVAKSSATNPLKPSSFRPSQYRAAVAEKIKNQGAAAAESDATFNANAQDENYLAMLATDPGDRKKLYESMKAEHGQEIADRVMGNVRNTQNDSVALRQRALSQLATTGRHFETGKNGYDQMAKMAAGIAGGSYDSSTGQFSGGDRALYASTMNEAQAMAGKAGRWDLAGTNNGAGYSFEAGWNKASPYEIANGKKQAIRAAIQHVQNLDMNTNEGKRQIAKIGHEARSLRNNAKGELVPEIDALLSDLKVAGSMSELSAEEAGARAYRDPSESQRTGNNQGGGGSAGGEPGSDGSPPLF